MADEEHEDDVDRKTRVTLPGSRGVARGQAGAWPPYDSQFSIINLKFD
jgi:hypothetical protein